MRPRIRTVKPELLTDEDLWDLEHEHPDMPILRAFQGLWMYADREGRFEWRPRVLGPLILPFWSGDFSRVLDALATRGFLVRYACRGRDYGAVRTFRTHQVVNNREPASVLPEPPQESIDSAELTRDSRVVDATFTCQSPARARAGMGREGKGNGNGNGDSARGRSAPAGTRLAEAAAKGPTPVSLVWQSYSQAYSSRYGAAPTWNAKVAGQLAQLVKRVPAGEAPDVAAHYVCSQNARYVASGHAVGPLLQDAEKLRTEWLTGRQGTSRAAQQADEREGRRQEYEGVIERLQQRIDAE